MNGIVLAVNTNDYTSELKIGDLVTLDDYDDFYEIVDINDTIYDRKTQYKYYIRSKINNNLMNFKRSELSKAYLAVFDLNSYYNYGKKIKIGNITQSDIRNMKFKYILEHDLNSNKINDVTLADLIGLEFFGEINNITINNMYQRPETVQYFKLLHNDIN